MALALGWPHRRTPGWHVAHVLHVALPRQAGGRQLVADRLDRSGVHAPQALVDAAHHRCPGSQIVHAVGLVEQVRWLARHHGDVVVVAGMTDRVEVRQVRRSLVGSSPIRIGTRVGEGGSGALVLEDDLEDCLWAAVRCNRRGSARHRDREGGAEQRGDCVASIRTIDPIRSRRTAGLLRTDRIVLLPPHRHGPPALFRRLRGDVSTHSPAPEGVQPGRDHPRHALVAGSSARGYSTSPATVGALGLTTTETSGTVMPHGPEETDERHRDDRRPGRHRPDPADRGRHLLDHHQPPRGGQCADPVHARPDRRVGARRLVRPLRPGRRDHRRPATRPSAPVRTCAAAATRRARSPRTRPTTSWATPPA